MNVNVNDNNVIFTIFVIAIHFNPSLIFCIFGLDFSIFECPLLLLKTLLFGLLRF
jgi:hypothetical protein